MTNTVNDSAIRKLKLVVTVVDRPKAEFYMDVLSQFEVNCQFATAGMGTATSELVDLLGLNPEKTVIFSVAREDQVDPIMKALDERFHTIRKGKGISIAIPMSSVIGVNMYRFLSNHQEGRFAP
ncbi:MAG: hypothetical protein J6A74_04690 [Oscillospiraceae bacterium]|nr:hypothetical protein [Oscillospiraceae bacterium]